MSYFTRSRLLLGMALVAAVFAGLYVGRALRARTHSVVEPPPFPFKTGETMPDVALLDSLGTTVQLSALVQPDGAVVLFLDPECDGCTAMATRWERALAEGTVGVVNVFGISRAPATTTQPYRAAHHLSYPIYQDAHDAFLGQYGLASYPLEVVVGRSGTVRSVSDNSVSPIDAAAIEHMLSE
jgi:peroxiredoxin